MNISTLIENVLPNDCILAKDSGSWSFYLNWRDLEDGKDFTDQRWPETFEQFIERTIQLLIDRETADPNSDNDIQISYAIYSNK